MTPSAFHKWMSAWFELAAPGVECPDLRYWSRDNVSSFLLGALPQSGWHPERPVALKAMEQSKRIADYEAEPEDHWRSRLYEEGRPESRDEAIAWKIRAAVAEVVEEARRQIHAADAALFGTDQTTAWKHLRQTMLNLLLDVGADAGRFEMEAEDGEFLGIFTTSWR